MKSSCQRRFPSTSKPWATSPLGRALSGEQALAITELQRPDPVLMDIRLKGDMDGIAAAKEIRTRFDIPVIFLTAYSEDDTLERVQPMRSLKGSHSYAMSAGMICAPCGKERPNWA